MLRNVPFLTYAQEPIVLDKRHIMEPITFLTYLAILLLVFFTIVLDLTVSLVYAPTVVLYLLGEFL